MPNFTIDGIIRCVYNTLHPSIDVFISKMSRLMMTRKPAFNGSGYTLVFWFCDVDFDLLLSK